MTAVSYEQDILREARKLAPDQQQRVLDLIRHWTSTPNQSSGIPGWLYIELTRNLHIPAGDMDAIESAIEAAFGRPEPLPQVDLDV